MVGSSPVSARMPSSGAKADIKDKSGSTPLDLAQGDDQMIKVLQGAVPPAAASTPPPPPRASVGVRASVDSLPLSHNRRSGSGCSSLIPTGTPQAASGTALSSRFSVSSVSGGGAPPAAPEVAPPAGPWPSSNLQSSRVGAAKARPGSAAVATSAGKTAARTLSGIQSALDSTVGEFQKS